MKTCLSGTFNIKLSLQATLRGKRSNKVDRGYRRLEDPPKALENRLYYMVAIFSMQEINMQRQTSMLGNGAKKLLGQRGIESADLLLVHRHMVMKKRSVAGINHQSHQGLIHRQITTSVTGNATQVTQGGSDGLAEADADILDTVVIINVGVAFGNHSQIEKPVHGKKRQHVIEKGYAAVYIRLAAAVETQLQTNVGFFGGSNNFGLSWFRGGVHVCHEI
jgi:hypothetical protein